MIIATIYEITDQGVRLLIDGESAPTGKSYQRLSTYNPVVNDRVIVAQIGNTYVVLGKFVR